MSGNTRKNLMLGAFFFAAFCFLIGFVSIVSAKSKGEIVLIEQGETKCTYTLTVYDDKGTLSIEKTYEKNGLKDFVKVITVDDIVATSSNPSI